MRPGARHVHFLNDPPVNTQPHTYHSRLYRDFMEIDGNAFRTIVRFYEEYEAQILQLEFSEYFDLMVSYANALFRIGRYRQFLLMSDPIIEIAIAENIRFWNGEDVYFSTLLRKAAAHHQLLELDRTDHILRELLRIDPTDKECQMLMRRNLRRRQGALIRYCRASCILLLLCSVVVLLVEVLFVQAFYPEFSATVEWTRNGLFLAGVLVLAGGALLNYLLSSYKTAQFVQEARKKSGKKLPL